ncbi:MAG: hypothetical protein HKN42_08515 [Granulosicoccus sp.]|nr:hypothetical protein [Granulosicoccus sp.]
MKEERFHVTEEEFNRYLAEARRLRSQALARLTRQLFSLPGQIVNRLSGKSAGAASVQVVTPDAANTAIHP